MLTPTCDSRMLSELRAPLLSIHGALELALAGSGELLRAEDRDLLEIAVHSTERLARLMDGFLEVPAPETHPARAIFGAAVVAKLVDEAARAMAPMAISRSVVLDTACEPGLPAVDASHAGLARVLATLLACALEASPRGESVILRAARLGGFVEFSVTTTAAGVATKPAEEAFGPASAGRDPSPARSSLGLAICRTIIEQHGGRIWVEPATPTGWRFAFVIPLSPADQLADARRSQEPC